MTAKERIMQIVNNLHTDMESDTMEKIDLYGILDRQRISNKRDKRQVQGSYLSAK